MEEFLLVPEYGKSIERFSKLNPFMSEIELPVIVLLICEFLWLLFDEFLIFALIFLKIFPSPELLMFILFSILN
jgi:hypothetical protein